MNDPSASGPRRGRRLVVGCGYLGTRVADRWLAAGSRVFGITRRESRAAELAAHGIEPVVADVTAAPGSAAFIADAIRRLPEIDTVFWAVGFDRSAAASHRDVHVGGLSAMLDAFADGRSVRPRVILSSSTGVWGDADGGFVDETTPVHPSREAGRVLVEAESLLRTHPLGPGVSLRFAGLYGPGRLPRIADLQAGRPIPADPDSWLNMIHVDDAARIVCAIADRGASAGGEDSIPRPLYVVSDGQPVRRRDWYGRLADLSHSPPPTWDPAAPRIRGADKRVNPAMLFRDFEIALEHPDSLNGIEAILRGGPQDGRGPLPAAAT
jgi:nucleoside-diphosphate-sugar epimerase